MINLTTYPLPFYEVMLFFSDECKTGAHKCESGCVNTIGSHTCNCSLGFLLVNGTRCIGKTCVFAFYQSELLPSLEIDVDLENLQ